MLSIQCVIREDSPLIGKTVKEAEEEFKIIVTSMTIREGNEVTRVVPDPQRQIEKRSEVEVQGERKDVMKFFKKAGFMVPMSEKEVKE